ncbi:hypothetical protein HK098_007247 [Nowakowskiella sp. JEL0407]|nr:hypothetical protein HK098_007247 [Nowakowskiella sp. JEL0407]
MYKAITADRSKPSGPKPEKRTHKLDSFLLFLSILTLSLIVISHSTANLILSYNVQNDTLIATKNDSDPKFIDTLSNYILSHSEVSVGFWLQCQGGDCIDVNVPGCGVFDGPKMKNQSDDAMSLRSVYVARYKSVCTYFNMSRLFGIAAMSFGVMCIIALVVNWRQVAKNGGAAVISVAFVSSLLFAACSIISVVLIDFVKQNLDVLGDLTKLVNQTPSNTDSPYFNTFYKYLAGFWLIFSAAISSVLLFIALLISLITSLRKQRNIKDYFADPTPRASSSLSYPIQSFTSSNQNSIVSTPNKFVGSDVKPNLPTPQMPSPRRTQKGPKGPKGPTRHNSKNSELTNLFRGLATRGNARGTTSSHETAYSKPSQNSSDSHLLSQISSRPPSGPPVYPNEVNSLRSDDEYESEQAVEYLRVPQDPVYRSSIESERGSGSGSQRGSRRNSAQSKESISYWIESVSESRSPSLKRTSY